MQVAIIAGGLGTRLGDLTRNHPKSMIRIEGKVFLEHQLELLKRSSIRDIVLCLGHMGEQIERHFEDGNKHNINVHYSIEHKPLGTAGALKNAEHLLNDIFFSMYGDSYLPVNFGTIMSYFKSQNKLALMTVYKNYDSYDRSNTAVSGNLVKRYSKRDRTEDMDYIDYGAHIFRKEALKLIPENRFSSLDELFTRLIEMEELLAFEVQERFYEIGSPQGLKDFRQYIKETR